MLLELLLYSLPIQDSDQWCLGKIGPTHRQNAVIYSLTLILLSRLPIEFQFSKRREKTNASTILEGRNSLLITRPAAFVAGSPTLLTF